MKIASSVFFMCFQGKVLVFGDCAINTDPTSEELASIAISSADTAAAFGVEPRVALLSYATGDSNSGTFSLGLHFYLSGYKNGTLNLSFILAFSYAF